MPLRQGRFGTSIPSSKRSRANGWRLSSACDGHTVVAPSVRRRVVELDVGLTVAVTTRSGHSVALAVSLFATACTPVAATAALLRLWSASIMRSSNATS